MTDAANAVGQELIDTVQTTGKTFTYVKEPESSAALLSLIPPTGTLSPGFDPERFQYSLSVPFSVTSLVFDAQPAEDCSVRVNRKNLGAGGSTADFEFTVTSESGETAVYTVAVTRETKPVTAVAGKTGTSSAAKGKDAASSEKPAESEAAEANVEEAPAETTVVTGEARDADLTQTEAEKNARAVQTDRLVTAAIVLLAVAFGFMLAVLWQRVSEKKGEKSGPRHGA